MIRNLMNKTPGAEISPISLLVNSTNGHIICKRCDNDSGYGSIKGIENMYEDDYGNLVCDPCADQLDGLE